MAKIKGIDISYHQGNIDFKKVVKDGIKFAVIRQGYRKSVDSKFLTYVKGCLSNNIPIMVYHFIYTDGATPKQNAQSTYNNIKKIGLDPTKIWIAADLEYDTWKKNGQKCTRAKCTKYTKQYLDTLKSLGCNKLFIYVNIDYYKNYYDWSQLKYPIWLADYNGEPNYSCVMQQYTSGGKVNGISGNVDVNWLFDESMLKDEKTTVTKTSSTEITITADKVLNIARGELGYKEKASNSNLDNKTANAGSSNYTKYARDFDTKYTNWYNGKKNGYAWCDMFVDWCFLTAFGSKKAMELLCQPEKSAGAGCIYSYSYYNKKGQTGRIPKVGAQIFFGKTPQTLEHTGLVYKFDDTYVYTIEGNSSNMVAERKYKRSATNLWYGYPKYEGTIKASAQGTDLPTPKKTIEEIAKEVIDGKWGSGEQRKAQLKNAGYDYQTVQNKVNELLGGKSQTVKTSTSTVKVEAAKGFNKALAKTFTTTAKVNMRAGAGTSKTILTVVPNNTAVKCYGYYTNDWYYVKYKDFTGFIYSKYLK